MKRYLTILCLASLLLISSNALAENSNDEPDVPPVEDPGKVPVNDYISFLVIGAIILAYRFLPKKVKE